MHIGSGSFFPSGTALCIYSGEYCSQEKRLRRCHDLNAANCADPIWCAGSMLHVRFEGRPKQKVKLKKTDSKSSAVTAICDAQIHQVSSSFWFSCWIVEQILNRCELYNPKANEAGGITSAGGDRSAAMLTNAINSILSFAIKCSVPTLKQICWRLLARAFLKLVLFVELIYKNAIIKSKLEMIFLQLPNLVKECAQIYNSECDKDSGDRHSSYLQSLLECIATAHYIFPGKFALDSGESSFEPIHGTVDSMSRVIALFDSKTEESFPSWFIYEELRAFAKKDLNVREVDDKASSSDGHEPADTVGSNDCLSESTPAIVSDSVDTVAINVENSGLQEGALQIP